MTQSLADFSLIDPKTQQCPFAFYDAARAQAPVHFMEDIGMYLITSYDLLRDILKDPETFSNRLPEAGANTLGQYEKAEKIIKEKGYGRFMPTIVNNDPPGHGIYRSLVDQAFRAGRIRQMESYVEQIVGELIDSFANDGHCEAISQFAVPVPMYVIADQLGVPRENFQRFKEWSDAWVAGLGLPKPEEEMIEAAELIVEMQHYMIERIHERRKEPRNDMLSDLARATYNGERPLEDKEVLSIVEQILVAGNETTTNGIGNGLLTLATNPEVQDRIRQDPELVTKFTEEVLRWESPVQGLFRYVTKDTTLAGTDLPKGSRLMVRYAAANRDPSKFDCPQDLNIDRKNNGAHLAFGSGIHHCVGSQLARVEMQASFKAWLARFSSFELDQPEDSIQYHMSFALRGPESLKLKFTAAE